MSRVPPRPMKMHFDSYCACGRGIRKPLPEPYTHLCTRCYLAVPVTKVCPRCENERTVSMFRHIRTKPGGTEMCAACTNQTRPAKVHVPKPKMTGFVVSKTVITMHGCQLIRSAKLRTLPGCLNDKPIRAARCVGYTRCRWGMFSDVLGAPKKEQCLIAVSRLTGWEGWDSVGPGHPMNEHELDAVICSELARVPEVGFLDAMYEPM